MRQVAEWIEAVSLSMTAVHREEAEAYQRLDGASRWARVRKACRGATRWLAQEQRERIESRAESDHQRFGALMREIRAGLGG